MQQNGDGRPNSSMNMAIPISSIKIQTQSFGMMWDLCIVIQFASLFDDKMNYMTHGRKLGRFAPVRHLIRSPTIPRFQLPNSVGK